MQGRLLRHGSAPPLVASRGFRGSPEHIGSFASGDRPQCGSEGVGAGIGERVVSPEQERSWRRLAGELPARARRRNSSAILPDPGRRPAVWLSAARGTVVWLSLHRLPYAARLCFVWGVRASVVAAEGADPHRPRAGGIQARPPCLFTGYHTATTVTLRPPCSCVYAPACSPERSVVCARRQAIC
jgi:hypothetical protein